MYKRFVQRQIQAALKDTPVVLVTGARRVGKTTLVRGLETGKRKYLTLDDQTTLDAAKADPVGFIRGLDTAIIDEIQRAPDLLLAIKKSVDDDYRPGRFLLTGSANVLTLPKVADSLAGRIEAIHMRPLARAEITGRKSTFLRKAFEGKPLAENDLVLGDDLIRLVLTGGFPEALSRSTERRQQDWSRAYLQSILTRDLRDIAEIDKLTALPKFVQFLAQHSAQPVNYSAFGNSIDINYKTSQRYVGLLEQVFLVSALQPWYTNAVKRLIKAPKLHFQDSGLLCAARGLNFDRIKKDRTVFGAVLESFVHAELMKLVAASDLRLTPYHFRDQQKREVDIVLERDDGQIVGIEVKASATVANGDLSGLRVLAEASQDKFSFGMVLYDGHDVIPFGKTLAAVPISSLWN